MAHNQEKPHTALQCCGSGMCITNPESKCFLSRIRNFSIPDPVSASNNLSILTLKIGFSALGNMIRVVHVGSGSRIRIMFFDHPGSRGQKGTGSRIRNTAPPWSYHSLRTQKHLGKSHLYCLGLQWRCCAPPPRPRMPGASGSWPAGWSGPCSSRRSQTGPQKQS